MDWKKIQNDINESFSKLKADQLSEKEMSEFYEENLKHLFEIRNEEKEKSHLKTLSTELRKKIILVDSLRKVEIGETHRSLLKVEKWEGVKGPDRSHGKGNNFYNYDLESAPLPRADINELAKNNYAKVISISNLKNKNAKIIVDNLTRAFKESKNSFHYSISNNPGNETKQKKIITIEVNEIP